MGWAEVCSRHASPVRVISPPRPMAFQFIHVFPNAWQPFCLMTMIAPFSGEAGFCACCSVTHSRAYQAVRVKARSCHFFLWQSGYARETISVSEKAFLTYHDWSPYMLLEVECQPPFHPLSVIFKYPQSAQWLHLQLTCCSWDRVALQMCSRLNLEGPLLPPSPRVLLSPALGALDWTDQRCWKFWCHRLVFSHWF